MNTTVLSVGDKVHGAVSARLFTVVEAWATGCRAEAVEDGKTARVTLAVTNATGKACLVDGRWNAWVRA